MIYYIRHGESQANADNVYTGPNYPAPLTDKGKQQAKLAGEKILADRIKIDNIISSTLDRAKDTAMIIANVIGFDTDKIQYDSQIVEYDVGSLSGKSEANFMPHEVVKAEGAENPYDFQKRIMARIEEFKKLPGNTLIIGHAGVGRMIEATKQRIDPIDFLEVDPYQNAQIVVLN